MDLINFRSSPTKVRSQIIYLLLFVYVIIMTDLVGEKTRRTNLTPDYRHARLAIWSRLLYMYEERLLLSVAQ